MLLDAVLECMGMLGGLLLAACSYEVGFDAGDLPWAWSAHAVTALVASFIA